MNIYTVTAGIGNIIAGLTTALESAGWDVLGNITSNHRVFGSVGTSGNENIIIAVDDTNANYYGIRAGDEYNDTTKVLSNPTTYRYSLKATTGDMLFYVFANKNRFIIAQRCALSYTSWDGCYCGLLSRFNTDDLTAVLCSANASTSPGSAATMNSFAHNSTFSADTGRLLYSFSGVANRATCGTALNNCFGSSQLPNIVDSKLIASPIIIGNVNGEIRGTMDGVYSLMGCDVSNLDEIIIGGVTYYAFVFGNTKICVKD